METINDRVRKLVKYNTTRPRIVVHTVDRASIDVLNKALEPKLEQNKIERDASWNEGAYCIVRDQQP